jgi:hypothetical protein
MSDVPYDIPPELIMMLLGGQAPLPDYSISEGQYMPMDLGTQAQGLNFVQDLYKGFLFDPMFAQMAGEGAYDPSLLGVMGQEGIAPKTDGYNMLVNVTQQSPGTPQALVAQFLIEGYSPQEAVAQAEKLATESGASWPKEQDANGNEVTSRQITDFANTSWQNLMGDTQGSGPRDQYERAGFTNPAARFTAELFDQDMHKGVEQASLLKKDADQWSGTLQKFYDQNAAAKKAAEAGPPAASYQLGPHGELRGVSGNTADDHFTASVQARVTGNPAPAGRFFGGGAASATPGGDAPRIEADIIRKLMAGTTNAVGGRQEFGPPMPITNRLQLVSQEGAARSAAGRAANASAAEQMKAGFQAKAATQQYGSPFLMQLAQRQAMARQLGILP